MKIITSFLLLAFTLTTANALQAQEIKAMVAPARVQANIPKAEDKPSPAPVLIPQPGVAAVAPAVNAVAETPSPFKKDEAVKPAPVAAVPVTEVQPPVAPTQMQPAHLRQQKN